MFRTVLYTGELCTVLYAVQYSIYTDLLGLYQHFANRARVHKIRTGVGRGVGRVRGCVGGVTIGLVRQLLTEA